MIPSDSDDDDDDESDVTSDPEKGKARFGKPVNEPNLASDVKGSSVESV
jgi:hypothetical protein